MNYQRFVHVCVNVEARSQNTTFGPSGKSVQTRILLPALLVRSVQTTKRCNDEFNYAQQCSIHFLLLLNIQTVFVAGCIKRALCEV